MKPNEETSEEVNEAIEDETEYFGEYHRARYIYGPCYSTYIIQNKNV
jgi:hypothetical protein